MVMGFSLREAFDEMPQPTITNLETLYSSRHSEVWEQFFVRSHDFDPLVL
jgi:hypothetical protein